MVPGYERDGSGIRKRWFRDTKEMVPGDDKDASGMLKDMLPKCEWNE